MFIIILFYLLAPSLFTSIIEYKEVLGTIENLEHSVHRMGYITPEHPKFSAMSKYPIQEYF